MSYEKILERFSLSSPLGEDARRADEVKSEKFLLNEQQQLLNAV